jgi:N-acyl-D-amino-acid deacylase
VTLEVFGEGWSMGPLPGPEHLEDFRRQVDAGDVPFDWQTLGEYLEALESRGVSPNIASFVGATTVRIHELGFDDRAPTPGELARMQKLVREAMEEGALGLSSSLIYPPAFFASTQELIALASAAGEYDGMYISHLRSETGGLMAAIEELVTIARQAGVSAEIYHLKLAGRRNWSNFDEVVGVIEAARRDGIRISANMYTYTAGVSGLAATVPPWVQAGGTDAFMERLSDSSLRRRVITQMSESSSDWENFFHASGPDGIVIAGGDANVVGELRGQSIGEIARQRDMDPRQLVVDLLLESRNSVRAVYFLMSEANVARQIALPWVSFGSDGDARAVDTYPGIPSSHPRVYGNVARLLGRYVREKGVISLAEAIRRLTSLPAENLGLRERGRLEPGYFADIVVFDPLTIRDLSTYEYPDQLSAGIEHVFVNGEHVIRDRKHTGALPGRVVRGPGWKPGQTKDGER